MALTPKRLAFIDEYLVRWNATEAAIAAGFSEKTAYSAGQRLLKDVEVSAVIAERVTERKMTADEALIRLREQAQALHTQFIRNDGTVDIKGLKEAGLGHLIKGTKQTRYGVVVEFYDAQAALDKLLRVHGQYNDKLAIDMATQGVTKIEIVRGDD